MQGKYRAEICIKLVVKLSYTFLLNYCAGKDFWIICCNSVVAIFDIFISFKWWHLLILRL